MIDKTIESTVLSGGKISYRLGRQNSRFRRIPNIRRPRSTVQLSSTSQIDVVILGDGYTTARQFERQLKKWISQFFSIKVYAEFAGAFRIRALYTPSVHPTSQQRRSYYRVELSKNEKSVRADSWYQSDEEDNIHFRNKLFESLAVFRDLNRIRYPLDLDVGSRQGNIHDELAGLYRRCVVCMLVATDDDDNISGRARRVPHPWASQTFVNVAFAANAIHEFSHSFAHLEDEYINGRGKMANWNVPSVPSIFSLSNLVPNDQISRVPWVHLSPWGDLSRQAAGTEPSPVMAWLWIGGYGKEKNVWHSEYRCLMNGRHDNFKFTQIATDDPTVDSRGHYKDETGANLRDKNRLCLWCQEIVVTRILEKTGQLNEPGSPRNINAWGCWAYQRWVAVWRKWYWTYFNVNSQIAVNEASYARMKPGKNMEALWRSDLYQPFSADPPSAPGRTTPLQDEEILLMLNG